MKHILITMFLGLSVSIFGEVLILQKIDGTQEKFLKDKNSNVYYKNGVKAEYNKLVSSNSLVVDFFIDVDYEKFANEYNLKFEKRLSRLSKKALFSIKDNEEIICVINKIVKSKNPDIKFISPNWIRKYELN